jgi:hypothetical protein
MPGALVISAVIAAAAAGFGGERPGDGRVPASLQLELAAPWATETPADLSPHDALLLGAERSPGAEGEPAPSSDRTHLLRKWERTLKWSTAGALIVTSTLGTMAAIDQPTIFGDGRCQTGGAVLGTYGCDRGLSTLHGASGVVSAILYTADGALALSLPGPIGNVGQAARPWHRALTYVHLGGMVLQPVLGLVSAFPQVLGVRGTAPGDRFPRNVRTAHVFLGYVTTAAFLTTLALEW